jgi:hypothetical protein
MATKVIQNSLNNTSAKKRTRYDKLQVAYGRILVGAGGTNDANVGDVVKISLPMKAIVHAEFKSSAGDSLTLFNKSSLSPTWDVTGTPTYIDYYISYIRGTGKPGLGGNAGATGVTLNITLS